VQGPAGAGHHRRHAEFGEHLRGRFHLGGPAQGVPSGTVHDPLHTARVGLGQLARDTLGTDKSADGLQSLEWVRQGRLDLVEEYCRHDVEILRDLYLHGRREGCLHYHDRRRDVRLRLAVNW